MLRIALIRPGSTDYDEQGRIAGTLDIPLCHQGAGQVSQLVDNLAGVELVAIYAAPCQASQQTALALGATRNVKVRTLDKLTNLDMGLWQGKRIDDVRQCQRKLYRQWQEKPQSVCPPEGETITEAVDRMGPVIDKLFRRHRNGVVALVVPEPLCSIIRSYVTGGEFGDLWAAESDCGSWEFIEPPKVPA